jgi:Glycosyltransferase family 9 (heptosyltransferase)
VDAPSARRDQVADAVLPIRTLMQAQHEGPWRRPNTWLYRLGEGLRRLPELRLERHLRRSIRDCTSNLHAGILYAAWGRLGDALLAAPFTARLRDWFGGPVTAVGRPETAPVLTPQVDRFVALDVDAVRTPAGLRHLASNVAGRYDLILCDLHLFHGGLPLAALVDALPSGTAFAYAGPAAADTGHLRPSLPARATVVPARRRQPGSTDPDEVHIWNDLIHYHRAVLDALGRGGEPMPTGLDLPHSACDSEANRRFGLDPGTFVGCQPGSSQPKKDWPVSAWNELFRAFPDRRFALLGLSPRTQAAPLPANALDLRGRTTLPQALQLAATGAAFVGVDSGLTHAAACAGRPTVCVQPASTLGRFFPYPPSLGRPHVQAVWNQAYGSCKGCGGICAQAPLWRTHRHGFPCLVSIPVQEVAHALTAALASATATTG